MTVKLNKDTCIGCGSCAAICPAVFEMTNEGKAKVKKTDAKDKCVKEAEEACPTDAISVK